MPNIKQLMKDGYFSGMQSSIPEVSSVSWSSIITGKNPGGHGIYGFTDFLPYSYTVYYPSFNNLKAYPFWQINQDKVHVIINVPSTYPAGSLNGFLVSGFVSLDIDRAVHPKEYINILKHKGYVIDVDSAKAYKSDQVFMNNLFKVHDKRIELSNYLWQNFDWDVYMLVFTGSDRLCHFFWDTYMKNSSEHRDSFLHYFGLVDKAIGEINNCLSEDDNLLILSDHGMCSIDMNVNINKVLEDHGLLKFESTDNKKYKNIKYSTKAFSLDPSRIYLNTRGRFPNGFVRKSDATEIVNNLIDLFESLRYNGKKVIKKAYTKKEIYYGKYEYLAPDIVLVPNGGFSLHCGIGKNDLFYPVDHINGMHNRDAFLLIKNRDNDFVSNPCVEDVARIICKIDEDEI